MGEDGVASVTSIALVVSGDFKEYGGGGGSSSFSSSNKSLYPSSASAFLYTSTFGHIPQHQASYPLTFLVTSFLQLTYDSRMQDLFYKRVYLLLP